MSAPVYTVKGFQIATVEQARTILLVFTLQRDMAGAEQALAALRALEGAAK